MSVETLLVAALDAHAPLSALVGTRIYAALLPQSVAWPAITYSVIDSEPAGYTIAGPLAVERAAFAIDIRAETYAEMSAIAGHVRDAVIAATTFTSIIGGSSDFPYEDGAEVYRRTSTITMRVCP
jgi:hypothetical protein